MAYFPFEQDQRDIDFIIRILVLIVTQLGILLGISFAVRAVPLVEGVRMAAVIVALVPQGLFFMVTGANLCSEG